MIRRDAWAWEEIGRSLEFFAYFLRDVKRGVFQFAHDDHVLACGLVIPAGLSSVE